MTILKIEPGKHPVTAEIDGSLESLQQTVGGYIQAVYPFEDPVAVVCNDDGKLLGLEPNRCLCDDHGKIYDVLVGTFFICGIKGENFATLPENLLRKYSEFFKSPECFINTPDGLFVFPLV